MFLCKVISYKHFEITTAVMETGSFGHLLFNATVILTTIGSWKCEETLNLRFLLVYENFKGKVHFVCTTSSHTNLSATGMFGGNACFLYLNIRIKICRQLDGNVAGVEGDSCYSGQGSHTSPFSAVLTPLRLPSTQFCCAMCTGACHPIQHGPLKP